MGSDFGRQKMIDPGEDKNERLSVSKGATQDPSKEQSQNTAQKKDNVYAAPLHGTSAFEFNGQVADVFENMIDRSVPGYRLILDMIKLLTARYAQPGTHCYDLGCSLGASTLCIRQQLPADCTVIGIDSSPDMVSRCRNNVDRDHSEAGIRIIEQDVRETIIENASVVVMNFTLQFIPDKDRNQLLRHIADGLNDNGILILCEKIRYEDDDQQAVVETLHREFKRFHGYSDLEIAQKRAALENVLVPNSPEEHRARLLAAGFTSVHQIVQCLNFVAILAKKS